MLITAYEKLHLIQLYQQQLDKLVTNDTLKWILERMYHITKCTELDMTEAERLHLISTYRKSIAKEYRTEQVKRLMELL